jgi:hypothetical protein
MPLVRCPAARQDRMDAAFVLLERSVRGPELILGAVAAPASAALLVPVRY